MEPPPLGHAPREGRTPPSKGFSPTWGREGGVHPLLSLYKEGYVGVPFSFIQSSSFCLFLLPSSDSPCLESLLGWGFLHHTHVVVLLESGSESIFFHCSSGSELGGNVGYTVCM